MSFLPTAFLTFFGDEREREREREIEESVSLLEGERGVFKGGEEVKKAVERHGMDLKS